MQKTSETLFLKQIGNHFLLHSGLNPFTCIDKTDTFGFNPVIFLTALLKYNLRVIKFTYHRCESRCFFSKFTELYMQHHNPILEHFHHP